MCFSQNWLTQKNIITSKVNKLTRKIDDQSRKREYERKRMLNLLTNLETIRDIISRAESSVKNFISAVLTIGNTLLPPLLTTSRVLWNCCHLTIVKSIFTNDGIRHLTPHYSAPNPLLTNST